MKAIVHFEYGSPDVIKLIEAEKPTPNEDQVLVKVHAASINSYDWRHMRAKPFLVRTGGGLLKPKDIRLGADIAGTVEAVGSNVTLFKPGDEVFGDIGAGGYTEYACASEKNLALKPANVSFEVAAALRETAKNFAEAESIEIRVLALYENSDTVAGELHIVVDGKIDLYVVDVVTINAQGKVTAIRSYKGRGDWGGSRH